MSQSSGRQKPEDGYRVIELLVIAINRVMLCFFLQDGTLGHELSGLLLNVGLGWKQNSIQKWDHIPDIQGCRMPGVERLVSAAEAKNMVCCWSSGWLSNGKLF